MSITTWVGRQQRSHAATRGTLGHPQPHAPCSLGHLTPFLTSKPVLVQIILQIIEHAIAVARWLQCSDCGGKFAEAGCKDVGKLFN